MSSPSPPPLVSYNSRIIKHFIAYKCEKLFTLRVIGGASFLIYFCAIYLIYILLVGHLLGGGNAPRRRLYELFDLTHHCQLKVLETHLNTYIKYNCFKSELINSTNMTTKGLRWCAIMNVYRLFLWRKALSHLRNFPTILSTPASKWRQLLYKLGITSYSAYQWPRTALNLPVKTIRLYTS